jgi:hypothetical protein
MSTLLITVPPGLGRFAASHGEASSARGEPATRDAGVEPRLHVGFAGPAAETNVRIGMLDDMSGQVIWVPWAPLVSWRAA